MPSASASASSAGTSSPSAAAVEHLAVAADVGRDDRTSGRHRLHQSVRHALFARRQREHVHRGERGTHVVERAGEADERRDAERVGMTPQVARPSGRRRPRASAGPGGARAGAPSRRAARRAPCAARAGRPCRRRADRARGRAPPWRHRVGASSRKASTSMPFCRSVQRQRMPSVWPSMRSASALTSTVSTWRAMRAPCPSRAAIGAGQAPLAGEQQRDAGEAPRQRADQRGAPLIAVHDVDLLGAQPPRRAQERAHRRRRRQPARHVERRDRDARGAQLVLDLAAGTQREDARLEAPSVEQAQHLLEVALRAAGPQQRREVRDARHAAASLRRIGRLTTRTACGSGSPST